ncbi:helix-turn-helix domain-containing protein [Streptomyces sp. MBT53]|uniref:helix-turn-helix domain-containing protein n=1 Tax=Streptomyces sp. MBT53 TaxID=1488384 RepID=UPI0019142F74|nr:helix-turn-helix transcriptional regulator [Streptomyces sp. MBT53]MBK6015588.1 helix-turn-helix transcriptional regulator [Streptomyces sp. MBT53]
MEHTNSGESDLATPEQFGAWLKGQLEQRGYDLKPRGGGQSRFAEDAGLGGGTVSRILRGQAVTETRTLQAIAAALRLPLAEVLVAAGVLSARELHDVRNPTRTDPLTPETAADELGITDPQSRRLFVNMTATLREQRAENGEGRIAEN